MSLLHMYHYAHVSMLLLLVYSAKCSKEGGYGQGKAEALAGEQGVIRSFQEIRFVDEVG